MIRRLANDPRPGVAGATKLEKADIAVSCAAGQARDNRATKALGAFSEAADEGPLAALATLVAVAGAWRGDPRLLGTGLRMLAAFALSTSAKSVLKRLLPRTRPHVVMDGGDYRAEPLGEQREHENAFPSGHAARAVAVARAAGREHPGIRPFAWGAAAVVSAVQVPRAAHYVLDVIGGVALGLASEAVVHAAAQRIKEPRRPRSRPLPRRDRR
jgi:membrane-associated phospholipid phosphatase